MSAAIEILERRIATCKEDAKRWHKNGRSELYRFNVMCADVLGQCKSIIEINELNAGHRYESDGVDPELLFMAFRLGFQAARREKELAEGDKQ